MPRSTDDIRRAIDAAIEDAAPNAAIYFGEKLFAEFQNRGWFTDHPQYEGAPAYADTHLAVKSNFLRENNFRVGPPA